MKRQKLKRNRSKYVNLVELVRNRMRYHPYVYQNSRSQFAPLLSRLSTQNSRQQSIWNNRINSEANVRKRRTRSAHSRRHFTSRPEIITATTEDRGVDASPTYSSVHTQYEPYSQPSIPSELRRLLQEESSDSNEDVNANTSTKIEQPIPSDYDLPQSSGTCSAQRNNLIDLTDNDDNNVHDVYDEEVQEVEEQEHISDEPDELEEHNNTSDNTLNNNRSRVLELPEQPEDVEAGGDGHHNNSVIEIEITLTSSNDTNSEEEENVIVDEESEEQF